MSTTTRIEWSRHVWGPTVGCTKISPGCRNCYAEKMAHRLQAMGVAAYANGFQLTLLPQRLEEPVRRKTPTMYFVDSMSDLFHEEIPFEYIERVFGTIARCPQHTFQVLTKRAQRMADYFATRAVPGNAWIGVSVEDRRYGVPRIAPLHGIDAPVRFLSIEPLLEDLGRLDLRGIHWIIIGGESTRQGRPMREVWVENILEQAKAAGAAVFFKQWGEWGPDGVRRGRQANGRLQGRTWDELPRVS
jgi:protein gp37